MTETIRRNQESATLDEVIFLFKKKIGSVQAYLNARVDAKIGGKKYAHMHRKSTAQIHSDTDHLAQNVAKEASFWNTPVNTFYW